MNGLARVGWITVWPISRFSKWSYPDAGPPEISNAKPAFISQCGLARGFVWASPRSRSEDSLR